MDSPSMPVRRAGGADSRPTFGTSPGRVISALGGTLQNRGQVAPVDLMRSRSRGVALLVCPECGGERRDGGLRHTGPDQHTDPRGGVIHHTKSCSIPPIPRQCARRPARLT